MKNKHGPMCRLCEYEKRLSTRAGFCGTIVRKYCSNKKSCDGFLVNPPEYKKQETGFHGRGGGARKCQVTSAGFVRDP
jgi:hypothetical protein